MKFWKKVNIGSTSLPDKNTNRSLFVRWLTMQHRLVYKRFVRANVPTLIYCCIVNGVENKFLTNRHNEIHYFLSTRQKDNDSAAHKDGNIKRASSMNR